MSRALLRRWAHRGWPALALLVVYYLLLGSGRQALHDQYATRIDDWARRGVTTARLARQDRQRSALSRKVQGLIRQKREAEEVLTRSALFFQAPSYANRASERLSALLVERGLRIREMRQLDAKSEGVAQSRLALDVGGWYRNRPGAAKGQVLALPRPWVLGIEGDYPVMRQALAALQGDPLLILPFALSMEQDDSGGRVWTLGVWL